MCGNTLAVPVRRALAALAAVVCVLTLARPAFAVVAAPNSSSDTSVAAADLRPNSLPGPNSGAKPTQPGDRGGSLQFATFGLMCAGLTFIGWRIVAAGRRARRLSSVNPAP